MLNFWNLEFMSRDLYCHVLLPCAKFHRNRLTIIMAGELWPKRFLKCRPRVCLDSWILKMFIFGHVEFQICCCIHITFYFFLCFMLTRCLISVINNLINMMSTSVRKLTPRTIPLLCNSNFCFCEQCCLFWLNNAVLYCSFDRRLA